MGTLHLTQCPSEIGAGTRGASLGPQALQINAAEQNFPLFADHPLKKVPVKAVQPYHAQMASLSYSDEFVTLYKAIHDTLVPVVTTYDRHLIFTGDHSSAAGVFGAFKAQMPNYKWGIVWIDAHGDLHTPFTTPSGNYHGMPVANILGLNNHANAIRTLDDETLINWESMQNPTGQDKSANLSADSIFFVDIRDLEQEEWDLIQQYNMAYTTPETRKNLGIRGVKEKVEHFAKDFEALYVSFDVDSLDADLVPGTGTPVKEGLNWQEAETLLAALWALPQTKALEITEINPLRDWQNSVAHHMNSVLSNVLGNSTC